ncbi:hypothetical protein Q9Q94_05205 [Uliginosibacterium sp. 31-16]|uniref:hypothetical protein n=1 Tax=Uliginosibacterium sp. 31-16 TaxID=3068315 RepID=UPI002740054C|nr:hypothetical protein [Uliginosibacterium sp. 31-16]MDP5238915.1 hypothetical protein [Uliginosibacterium sp. 31-16]
MANYQTSDKAFQPKPDKGSGEWCSVPTTLEARAYKQAIQLALRVDEVELRVGREAVAHMRHYLDNTGTDLQLDLAELMQRSSSVRKFYAAELAQAQAFCETLAPGRHTLNSTAPQAGYFLDMATERGLQYGIGGYSCWGQGTVEIVTTRQNLRRHSLDFEFHFFDRYNWDSGKKFKISNWVEVEDEFMQQFHQQCLAKEFDIKGMTRNRVVWEAAQRAAPAPATARPPSRNPFDALK